MSNDHIAAAAALGAKHAHNAASWTVDGNTTEEHARHVLALLADGDPAADDYLPNAPNLSGEWSDELTPASLYEEITGDNYATAYDDAGLAAETLCGSLMDAICNAYEDAVSEHFGPACERELRKMIGCTHDGR